VNLVAPSPLYTSGRETRCTTGFTVVAPRTSSLRRSPRRREGRPASALGADPDGPTAYIRAKGAAEELVRDSSLDWVVVRPSVVFGEGGEFVSFTKTLTTPYVTGLPGGGSTRFQPIWVGDFVPILADCVDRDGHVGETYELGGPEVLTLADVTRAVYRADGKSVRILQYRCCWPGLAEHRRVDPGFPMGGDQYRSLAFDNTVSDNSLDEFGLDSGTSTRSVST